MPKIKLLLKIDEGKAQVKWKVWIKNGWVYHKQKPNAKQIQAYLANLAETLGKVINPPEIFVKGDECKTQPENQRVIDAYKEEEGGDTRSITVMPYARFYPFPRFVAHVKENATVTLLWEVGFDVRRIEHMRVLDIGCGDGNGLRDWVRDGVKVFNCFGVDIMPDRIKQAQSICPGMNLNVMGGEDLSKYQDGFFDVVQMHTVLSAIFDIDTRKKVISEAKRVLKPGGVMIVYEQEINNVRVKGLPVAELATLSGVEWLHAKIVPKNQPVHYDKLVKLQEKAKGLCCYVAVCKKGGN